MKRRERKERAIYFLVLASPPSPFFHSKISRIRLKKTSRSRCAAAVRLRPPPIPTSEGRFPLSISRSRLSICGGELIGFPDAAEGSVLPLGSEAAPRHLWRLPLLKSLDSDSRAPMEPGNPPAPTSASSDFPPKKPVRQLDFTTSEYPSSLAPTNASVPPEQPPQQPPQQPPPPQPQQQSLPVPMPTLSPLPASRPSVPLSV